MPTAVAIVCKPLPLLFAPEALHRHYALSFMQEHNSSINFEKINALRFKVKIDLHPPIPAHQHHIRLVGRDVHRICRLIPAFSLRRRGSFSSSVSSSVSPWFESAKQFSSSSTSSPALAPPVSSSASSPTPSSPSLAVLPAPSSSLEDKRAPAPLSVAPSPATAATPTPSTSSAAATSDAGFIVATRVARSVSPPQPAPFPLHNSFAPLTEPSPLVPPEPLPLPSVSKSTPVDFTPTTPVPMTDSEPPFPVGRAYWDFIYDCCRLNRRHPSYGLSFEERRAFEIEAARGHDPQGVRRYLPLPPEPCPAAFAVAVSE